ncbi:WxL domain-containing protein [Vagococcus sp. DIV0080]|uniref:WxL domain-containing protein n=1 Tax=Candidatus Vagococcus giribetii TaxID=2230876 RepID=A0ABS3HRY6_9ENTE|nr:WxL domain-containing protein [Vagococcus sp. DIV0080]MBO0476479.1 WxL domain-containing protein [Vagococcus sp. DIV0080]
MKKTVFFFFSLSLFMVGFINVGAIEKDSKEKEVTFELTENKNGLTVDAGVLRFGEHDANFNEIIAVATNPMTVSVTEFSGNRTGWTLKVSLDKFSNVLKPTETINGAQLFFPQVTPEAGTPDLPTGIEPVTLGPDKGFKEGDTTDGVRVNDNDSLIPIGKAEVEKGYGKWNLPYKTADDKGLIQLRIPANQKNGSYKSTVTYSVEDVP